MSQDNDSRKGTQGKHITYEQRQKLEWYITESHKMSRKKQPSQRRLAAQLNVSPATICRELRRGKVELMDSDLRMYKSYSAVIAQADHAGRGSAKGRPLKIGNDHAFARYVENKILIQKYSPDAVIMELKRSGNGFRTMICTRTLYSYISKDLFLHIGQSNLRRGGMRRKRKYEPVRRAYKGDGKGITERPSAVNDREEAGHWEMDCVVSGKGKGPACLLTLIERKSRYIRVIKLPNQTQTSVIAALDRLEKKVGKDAFAREYKSITSDNGSEFLDWRSVERSGLGEGCRTKHYYAHPNSSWERGSNENVNGVIRWFIPKSSSIGDYSNKRISQIQDWINNLPRRILGGRSAKAALA